MYSEELPQGELLLADKKDIAFPPFSMEGISLVEPEYKYGQVVGLETVAHTYTLPSGETIDCEVRNMYLKNPMVEANPKAHDYARTYLEAIEQQFEENGASIDDPRLEALGWEKLSPMAKEFCQHLGATALPVWRGEKVPYTEALTILRKLEINGFLTMKQDGVAQQVKISPADALMLNLSGVAIHIINRDTAEIQGMMEFASQFKPGETVKYLSIGTGTTENAFVVRKRALAEYGVELDITATDIADIRRDPIGHIVGRAALHEVDDPDHFRAITGNIFRGDKLALALSKKTGYDGQFQIVDMVGLAEYMDQLRGIDGVIASSQDTSFPYVRDFIASGYGRTAPGGVLRSGNMLGRYEDELDPEITDSELFFRRDLIDWPHIAFVTLDTLVGDYYASCPGAKLIVTKLIDATRKDIMFAAITATKPLD